MWHLMRSLRFKNVYAVSIYTHGVDKITERRLRFWQPADLDEEYYNHQRSKDGNRDNPQAHFYGTMDSADE